MAIMDSTKELEESYIIVNVDSSTMLLKHWLICLVQGSVRVPKL